MAGLHVALRTPASSSSRAKQTKQRSDAEPFSSVWEEDMLIPAEALRKAREGRRHEGRGFQFTGALRGPGGHSVVLIRQGTDRPMIKKVWPEAVALDAKFWQGLGEALGWSMRDVGR